MTAARHDPRQLYLPIFGKPEFPLYGIFAAAFPQRKVAEEMHRLGVHAERDGLFRGGLVPPHRLHTTLLWFAFDEVPPSLIETMGRAARSLVVAPSTFEMDEFVVTPNGVQLRASGGDALARVLRDALRAALRRESWMRGRGVAHAPHVTLGHHGGLPTHRAIEPVRFAVTGTTLVRSLHGEGVHERLAYIPFDDGPFGTAPSWVALPGSLPISRASSSVG